MKHIFLILLSTSPIAGYASGTHYTGILSDYSEPFLERTEYSFAYDFDGTGIDRECKTIIVKGGYDEKFWKSHPQPISKENHLNAMRFLLQKNNSRVVFGVARDGLEKLHSCRYLSRGLVLETLDQEIVVHLDGKNLTSSKTSAHFVRSDAAKTRRPF